MAQVKKEYKQAQLWSETHDAIGELVEYYNEQQQREYGAKAKKVSKAAVIDQLVKMKIYEISQG